MGIGHTEITEITDKAGAWYSLDGVKLDGKPTKRSAEGRLLPTGRKKGLYIHGGRKVAFRNYPFPPLFYVFL